MNMELYLPTTDEVMTLHHDIVNASGGLQADNTRGSLDYIISTLPYHLEKGKIGIAAHLMARIAKGHPFVDGNKRTAYFTSRYFLMRNGSDFNGTDFETSTDDISDVAETKNMNEAEAKALELSKKYFIPETGITLPDYNSFHRMVIKSIAIAKRLSDR